MSAWMIKAGAVVAAAAVGVGLAVWTTPPLANGAPSDGPAQAWIDDPVSGSTLALGPIEVVFHGYDPSGLSQLILTVDGVTITTFTPDARSVLAHTSWTWTPDEPGVYVLEAVGKGRGGAPGLHGHAVVTVGLFRVDQPTTTLPPSTTTTVPGSTTTLPPSTTTTVPAATTTRPSSPTTPPTTAPPTTAPPTTVPPPCTPPAPILLSPGDGFVFVGIGPITLNWSAWRNPPACEPSGFYAELALESDMRPAIASQHSGPETTEWSPPRTLWSCNTDYYWRVISKRADGSLGESSAVRNFRIDCP